MFTCNIDTKEYSFYINHTDDFVFISLEECQHRNLKKNVAVLEVS